MKKLITVFGPSECTMRDALYQDALELGRQLGNAGFVVVTGGYEGVMEAVSRGALSVGGSTVGVTAEVYYARGRQANEFLSREVKVKSAMDALMELVDIADAYVAIGNSTGTLAEVSIAWDYIANQFIEKKPLLLCGESWLAFKEYLEKQDGFRPNMHLSHFLPTVADVTAQLVRHFGVQIKLPELTIIKSAD